MVHFDDPSDSPTGWVNQHLRRYVTSHGEKGHEWRPGVPTLLLTTVGRRSGKARRTPLIYVRDGDRYAVVASNGGSDTAPQWYRNLAAEPRVRFQVGAEIFDGLARTASPEEKSRLWSAVTDVWPDYDTYQRRTSREIPVIILESDANR